MAQDFLITQKLLDTMQIGNEPLKQKIDQITKEPRVLDGPPPKYSPLNIDTTQISPFGVYTNYRTMYAKLYGQQEPKDGVVQIGENEVACPYSVLTALKTLVVCGVVKSAERAKACREVFGLIVSHRKNGVLTLDMLADALTNTGNYYKNEIIRAITDSVFSPEEQVELYVKRSLGKEYTPDVLELFANTDCLESFEEEVKQVYKRACCDASFAVTKRLGKVVNAVRYLQQIRLQ